VSANTGHTLAHYLYTGTYQILEPEIEDGTPRMQLTFGQALSTYMVAVTYNLSELELLAKQQIEEHGAAMGMIAVLDTIRKGPPMIEYDRWLQEYLKEKSQKAFEKDYTMFTTNGFSNSLGEGKLNRFMMRHVVELLSEKLTHTLKEQENMCTLENHRGIEKTVEELSQEIGKQRGALYGAISEEPYYSSQDLPEKSECPKEYQFSFEFSSADCPVEECAVVDCAVDGCAVSVNEDVMPVTCSIDECAVEECPVDECAVEECAVEECPVEECPVEECPVEECLVEECLVEECLVEECLVPDEECLDPVEECLDPVEECLVPVEECLVPVEECLVPVEECVDEVISIEDRSINDCSLLGSSVQSIHDSSIDAEIGQALEDQDVTPVEEEPICQPLQWEETNIDEPKTEPLLEIQSAPHTAPFNWPSGWLSGWQKEQLWKGEAEAETSHNLESPKDESAECMEKQDSYHILPLETPSLELSPVEASPESPSLEPSTIEVISESPPPAPLEDEMQEPSAPAESSLCPKRSVHLMKSDRWKKCKRCRAMLKEVTIQLAKEGNDGEDTEKLVDNILMGK
jgi:hypothetical protein